jgi:nicotinamidase-related amidase
MATFNGTNLRDVIDGSSLADTIFAGAATTFCVAAAAT